MKKLYFLRNNGTITKETVMFRSDYVANKAYLEITNVCNLSCPFCHGTKRQPRFMTEDDFTLAAKKLKPFADYLYYHLMGEPLLHPDLPRFLSVAKELGYKSIITTNGTLLREKGDAILETQALHKVSISLHSFEVNSLNITLEQYLEDCFEFCKKAAKHGVYAVMRLWNQGGEESLNPKILELMHEHFPEKWEERYSGFRVADRVFLEWGEKFLWPDTQQEDFGCDHSCYGLRDQVGVLCDGTVVPCCLDSEGIINLGNIFEQSIEEIISSPRAVSLRKSFEIRNITEPLCRRCGYAAVKRR